MPFDFGMLDGVDTPIAPGENILGFSFAPSNKTRRFSGPADGSSMREPAVALVMGDHPSSSVSPEVGCRGISIDDGTLDSGDEGLSDNEAMAGDDDAQITIEEEEDWLPMSATPAFRRSTASSCAVETDHAGRRPRTEADGLRLETTPRHDIDFKDTMEMNDNMEQDYISLDNGDDDNEDGSDDDWIMDLERTAEAGSLGTFMAALDEVSRSD